MSWTFYAGLIVCALMFQGFYSMMEMACVSFNKVRLHYYASQGLKRAKWLSYLLGHPGRFFGTTLIAVNTALQFGSESARQFYMALGLSPDWAPLTQVFLVLIFAELSPLFAGRKHSEHVAMLGIPILYFTSLILTPIITVIDWICRGLNRLLGVKIASGLYLTREELEKAVESHSDDFDAASKQIFHLKTKTAKEMMQRLHRVQTLPAKTTARHARHYFAKCAFVPIYEREPSQIVGIAFPRELLNARKEDPIRLHALSPWFITESTSILDILHQFRTNQQTLAVVLDLRGKAVGVLTLDAIIDEIFGSLEASFPESDESQVLIERTFAGDSPISEINKLLHIHLPEEQETINDLIISILGHPPTKGEIALCSGFELVVQEAALFGAKSVLLRTQK